MKSAEKKDCIHPLNADWTSPYYKDRRVNQAQMG